MKKKAIVSVVLLLMFLFCHFVQAGTKEQVLDAINQTYTVGKETYRLPQKIINKAQNYFNHKELSSEQYDKILASINKAVGIAQEAGTTDITKISKEDMNEALGAVLEASRAANVDLQKEIASVKKGISQEGNTKEAESKEQSIGKETNQENPNASVHETSGDGSSATEAKSEDLPLEDTDSSALIASILSSASEKEDDSVGKQFAQIVTYVVIGIMIEILLNIFIICLLLKAKWNKIIKYILITVLVIVILVSFVVLYEIMDRRETMRMAYELYYIFR